MPISKLKKTVSERHILYASNYVTSWKRQSQRDSKNISDCQELGGVGMNKWSPDDFQGNETILYDTIMMNTCQYKFLHIHRLCDTKSEPQCRLWVIMVCQHMFIGC